MKIEINEHEAGVILNLCAAHKRMTERAIRDGNYSRFRMRRFKLDNEACASVIKTVCRAAGE